MNKKEERRRRRRRRQRKERGAVGCRQQSGLKAAQADDIVVDCVKPSDKTGLYDVHTHGLEAHGHKEFQALCPGFTTPFVAALLRHHAECVVNHGERFRPGDSKELYGFMTLYVEVPGDILGDPTRLRLVDAARPCSCCGE